MVCRAREAPFRADQIRRWIFGKRVADFEQMHDLSKPLRAGLSEDFRLFASEVVRHQVASDRTEKLLLRLEDGSHIECVLMRKTDRRTICLSTQVGCPWAACFARVDYSDSNATCRWARGILERSCGSTG